MQPNLQIKPTFQENNKFKKTKITNEPKILKEDQIYKETQITNEPKDSK